MSNSKTPKVLTPEQTGQAYDQITHLWLSEKFNLENGISQHRRAIAFTDNRGPALDVGCGCTGRFFDLLQNEGFTPEGLDISTEMLRLAKERYPHLNFHHADICQWQPTQHYDFISGWDSLWHIPLDQQEPVLRKLLDSLSPGGVFIFTAGGTDEPGSHTDDFMGPEVYYATLGIPEMLRVIGEAGCICKHLEFDQNPEMHFYIIVQKPANPAKD